MLLKFKIADVLPLMEHSEAASDWRSVYGYPDSKGPGLILVKDDGAYLMSNGLPREKGQAIVYADGCRPEDGHIGGDDWAEFFPLSLFLDMRKAEFLEFRVRGNGIFIEAYNVQKKANRPKGRTPKKA